MAQFKKYRCQECEHLYDEELGDPDSGLAPGTLWDDIPDETIFFELCHVYSSPKIL
jgi:rubredoxin